MTYIFFSLFYFRFATLASNIQNVGLSTLKQTGGNIKFNVQIVGGILNPKIVMIIIRKTVS